MPTRLIVCADDFGWTQGINRGIIDAHKNGIVTATSLMVNAPYAAEAAKAAYAFPDLEVGVHLNIVNGRPILSPNDVPTLVDASGCFYNPKQVKLRALTGKFDRKELVAEFKAQIERAFELGISPSHIDSHHHVYIFPTIDRAFPIAMEGLKNTAVRGYVYHLVFPRHRPRWSDIVAYYARNPERLATHKWAKHVTSYFDSKNLRRADVMLLHPGIRNTAPPKTTVKGWCNIISEAKTNCINEVFCHPGYMDGGYCGGYTDHREREIMALTSDEVKEAVETAKVTLCGYSAIWKERSQLYVEKQSIEDK